MLKRSSKPIPKKNILIELIELPCILHDVLYPHLHVLVRSDHQCRNQYYLKRP
jgi:hypothetical protein